ncbi:PHO85 cyclin-5 [Teratosphaeriaceae sp. CCFEE 6253]|nr:PHO85 cyclin-5 [Teratosphaeriaceae sp. CCFEE 6253]
MSTADLQSRFDGFQGISPRSCGPYEPSIGSSAPSSQDSIFSDSLSAQSSIASSISDDFRSSQEDSRQQQQWLARPTDDNDRLACEQQKLMCLLRAQAQHAAQAPSYADVISVPADQRQNPRRSSPGRTQMPPPLTRQCERKINFVDNLVAKVIRVEDSATQMVQVIWPCSEVPPKDQSTKSGVLPLRVYIEETLRRSRTSYSTLQVALYYLILIKPFVPKHDFTMEQDSDCPASRALMCGRRMFLSALILASKYLQDRNYSAKAWSKMSGLPVNEINVNERTFLGKVCWKLHIPELIFKRWTEVVLKYTPSTHPPSPGQPGFGISWKGIVPLLTPELDRVPLTGSARPAMQCPANYGYASPTTPTPTKSNISPMQLPSNSSESTPTPLTVLPRFLEPTPDIAPPTPALARMGPLPTPLMTPSTVGSNTPAASAFASRRPSICSAMAYAQRAGLTRCTLDAYPSSTLPGLDGFGLPPSRRPSFATASSASSPESMVSDRTRSSRASSISSVSTAATHVSVSAVAPPWACLARLATCRSAGRLPVVLPAVVREDAKKREGGCAGKPIVIVDDADSLMASSPEVIDFSVSDKALHAPHRHSKHAPHHHHQHQHHAPATTAATASGGSGGEKGRNNKRARPRGGRRSDLQDEIRFQLEEGLDEMEIESDRDTVSPSPAAGLAARMLGRSATSACVASREAQPAAPLLLGREGSGAVQRVAVPKYEGKKRTCCSLDAMPAPSSLWGEVV